jgi:GT2 family glycosyltransferase
MSPKRNVNMTAKLYLTIASWNSMDVLPDLLKSLEEQTYQEYQVIIIDNNSEDGTVEFVRKNYPSVMLIRNMRNLGFAQAHNQGIRHVLSHSDPEFYDEIFILATNHDIVLKKDFLAKLMMRTKAHKDVGSFTGKLLKAYADNITDEVLKESVRSDMIDSTGLRAKKNRTFADRGAGEMDEGQYDDYQEIFGVSGALGLYRASALHDAMQDNQVFDQDFFAYKEDVDLAWRLQWLGWKARFVPEAVAYHYRGMYGKERMGFFERIKNRFQKSKLRSFYSNRNHWWLLVKNESIGGFLLAAPRLVVTESLRIVYTSIFEFKNLRSFIEALLKMPKMIKKRRELMKKRRVKPKVIRAWFV